MSKLRTQIQLEAEDHARIKNYAARRGISMAAAIRMLVRKGLGDDEQPAREDWNRLLSFAGSGIEPDGEDDVAREHNRFLYGKP